MLKQAENPRLHPISAAQMPPLSESPQRPQLFLFLHIGKTGGGSVRRGFWSLQECSAHRLPFWPECVEQGGVTVGNSNRHALVATPQVSFESQIICPALSPLAVLGACRLNANDAMQFALNNASHRTPIVHMAHYRLGTELSWLDAEAPGLPALANAHRTKLALPRNPIDFRGVQYSLPALTGTYSLFDERAMSHRLPLMEGSNLSSVYDVIRISRGYTALATLKPVSKKPPSPYAAKVAALLARQNSQWRRDLEANWGPFYAKLSTEQAVSRITMLRSPWTHLPSIFCSKGFHQMNYSCTDPHQVDMWEGMPRSDGASISRGVTLRLCGVDCEARFLAGASLKALEAQAAYNLRHSFAVVGVTEQFGGFIQAVRRLSPHLGAFMATGEIRAHGRQLSGSTTANTGCPKNTCTAFWSDAEHQSKGLQESQVIRQMFNLYNIALEIVNKTLNS